MIAFALICAFGEEKPVCVYVKGRVGDLAFSRENRVNVPFIRLDG
jgi:hypothetical protein